MSLQCPKCTGPVSVYWCRDFKTSAWLSPGYRDRDWIIVKAICPRHGSYKEKFSAFHKEGWIDVFAEAMFRCMKCERLGAVVNVRDKGAWSFFDINCPAHGLTGPKKIVTTLFGLIIQLEQQGIAYKQYVKNQPPSTYTICPQCGHMMEPLVKFCSQCGRPRTPK